MRELPWVVGVGWGLIFVVTAVLTLGGPTASSRVRRKLKSSSTVGGRVAAKMGLGLGLGLGRRLRLLVGLTAKWLKECTIVRVTAIEKKRR